MPPEWIHRPRSFRTSATTLRAAVSISLEVVPRPSPKRSDPCASCLSQPSANRTWLGSGCAVLQADPDETAAPHIIDHVGADCFMWATDYPHPDHPHTWVDDLTHYAQALPQHDQVAAEIASELFSAV